MSYVTLDASQVQSSSATGYPEPFASRITPREKRRLARALGLTRVGVNLSTLFPGKESSMRHYHSHEDELVYILEGEVVLVTDNGEEVLKPGMCAGFAAGTPNGHQLVNRGSEPARYLEISNVDASDSAEYTDVDMKAIKTPEGRYLFTHKDGSSY